MTLRDLPKNTKAQIIGFDSSDESLETRLREIGFAEGDNVEALHFGLFGRNPISIRLNGALIALRKDDAQAVLIGLV